jgi:hypothetical protein
MIHEIVVEHCTGTTGGYGTRVYSSASTFKARIEFKSKMVKDKSSRDVVSTTTLFTPTYDVNGTAATITVSDRITLPATFDLRQPPIITVEPHYDHEGPHHYEVYL